MPNGISPRAALVPTAVAAACACAYACAEAEMPSNVQVIRVTGSPYDRGLQQGRLLSSRIRSFHTQMLTASLFPYLNRLRPDLSRFLLEYQDETYDNGRFSKLLLGDSARSLEEHIPERYREELRGIADGSGLSYDQILVLNTFVDSILGMRSVAFFVDQEQAPRILSIALVRTASDADALRGDGADNDGDGEIDEAGEGTATPYEPSPHATFVEVPPEVRIRLVLADKDGVDPAALRLTLDDQLFVQGDPALSFREIPADPPQLEVTLAPPASLGGASVKTLNIQAGDKSLVTDPPPSHARYMRDERIVFTTRGHGRAPHEVPNLGVAGRRNIPPAVAFGVRGLKSEGGAIRLAHHFALLDNGTSHRHAAIVHHEPDDGPPFTVLTWCGILGGFSGMSSTGLAFAANYSDTLNNSVAQKVKEGLIAAKLEADGLPIGVIGRELLRGFTKADEAASWLATQDPAFGWNVLIADADRDLQLVEINSDVLDDGGVHRYDPDPAKPGNANPHGAPWASTSPDDLRAAVHYQAMADDIDFELLGFRIRPQRYWSSYYLRSVRAFSVLGERIAAANALDTEKMIEILRDEELVDPRDSMNAVVLEPETRTFRFAAGQIPATAAEFELYSVAPEANR